MHRVSLDVCERLLLFLGQLHRVDEIDKGLRRLRRYLGRYLRRGQHPLTARALRRRDRVRDDLGRRLAERPCRRIEQDVDWLSLGQIPIMVIADSRMNDGPLVAHSLSHAAAPGRSRAGTSSASSGIWGRLSRAGWVVRVRVLRRALAPGDLKRLQRFQEFVSVHVHLGTGVDN
jgi:hypothetical protein